MPWRRIPACFLHLRQGGSLAGQGGRLTVHWQVIADLARAAAAGHRGVTVARCRAAAEPAGPADVQPPAVHVAMGLLVDGRTPLPRLAASVRRAVRRDVRQATGLVDVTVELAALDLISQDGMNS